MHAHVAGGQQGSTAVRNLGFGSPPSGSTERLAAPVEPSTDEATHGFSSKEQELLSGGNGARYSMPGSSAVLPKDLPDFPSELGESPVRPAPITEAAAVRQAPLPTQGGRVMRLSSTGQSPLEAQAVPQRAPEGVGQRQAAAQDGLSAMIEAEAEAAAVAAGGCTRGGSACLQLVVCLAREEATEA